MKSIFQHNVNAHLDRFPGRTSLIETLSLNDLKVHCPGDAAVKAKREIMDNNCTLRILNPTAGVEFNLKQTL